jgi:type II secretion system protein N
MMMTTVSGKKSSCAARRRRPRASTWLWALALGACTHGPKPFVDIDKDLDRWDELGVPLIGDIAFKATLTSPKDEYATATGTVMVGCSHCKLGDGGRLKPEHTSAQARAFVGDGFEFPPIDLGRIDGTATFIGGKGTVELHLGTADSVDAELAGTVVLANDLAKSTLDLHLKFRASDKLRETDPKAYSLVMLTGANLDDKGWFKIHITGPLSETKRMVE